MKKNRKTGKKVISVLLSTAMVVSLAGCGKKEEVKPSVITGENEERVLNEILNGLCVCGRQREGKPGDRQ